MIEDDDAEVYSAWREDARRRRSMRRAEGEVSIRAIEQAGHTVQWLTEFHARVDGKLDLYPTNRRWHHLASGRRGGYGHETALQIVQRVLGSTGKPDFTTRSG